MHGWEMERTKGRSLVNKTSEGLDLEGSKRALVDRAVGAWTCVKEEKESNSFHSSSLIPLSYFAFLLLARREIEEYKSGIS